MDPVSLSTFAGALALAAATPGPGIAAIVARVLGQGARGGVGVGLGISVGDVVWLGLAVYGFAALAQAFDGVFLAVRYAGAAYLLYLGWRMWSSAPAAAPDAVSAEERESGSRLFLGGLALTLGNPKTIVFYLALAPNLMDLGTVTAAGFAELALVTVLTLWLVFAGYIVLASRARVLFRTPAAMRRVNRVTGSVLAAVAVAIVAR